MEKNMIVYSAILVQGKCHDVIFFILFMVYSPVGCKETTFPSFTLLEKKEIFPKVPTTGIFGYNM